LHIRRKTARFCPAASFLKPVKENYAAAFKTGPLNGTVKFDPKPRGSDRLSDSFNDIK
jgi:hypothetical protein